MKNFWLFIYPGPKRSFFGLNKVRAAFGTWHCLKKNKNTHILPGTKHTHTYREGFNDTLKARIHCLKKKRQIHELCFFII